MTLAAIAWFVLVTLRFINADRAYKAAIPAGAKDAGGVG